MTTLTVAPILPSNADARAGIYVARRSDFNLARSAIAIHYRQGISVKADQNAAKTWFEKAARQEVTEAPINLDIRHWRSRYVPENRILAYAWMRKTAGQGSSGAAQTVDDIEKNISEKDVQAAKKLSLTLT